MTTRHLMRREALKLGALGAEVVLLPPALRSARAGAAVAHTSPRKPPFQADLPIPPILRRRPIIAQVIRRQRLIAPLKEHGAAIASHRRRLRTGG